MRRWMQRLKRAETVARYHNHRRQNEGLASEKEAEPMDEEMRLDVAGRAGLPMVDLEHPRALG
jgi:hypothetical protein